MPGSGKLGQRIWGPYSGLLLRTFLLLSGLNGNAQATVPTITGISPSSAVASGAEFTLTVDGRDFMPHLAANPISPGAEVYWDDVLLATVFVSETRLTATVPARLIASAGTASITVVNPIFVRSNAVTFTIRLAPSPVPPLVIATDSPLRPGAVSQLYSHTLSASGGTPPRRWSIRSGTLPPGVTLDASSGILSGTPTTPGSFAFEVQVTDSAQATATRAFSLTVYPGLAITTVSPLPDGVVGVAYSATLAATGGLPPHRWSIRSGTLPPGLALDSASGLLAGSPANAGAFEFVAQVTDSLQLTATLAFVITVDSRTAIAAVVNGASFLAGPVAPGTIVTLFGTEIGPPNVISLRLGPSGLLDTVLAGTRVFFDGAPAPLIHAHAGQVSAVVPYAVVGRTSTEVNIEFQGARSRPFRVPLADSAPALFTLDASGRGQGAILNQDLSLNSSLNPARRGSIVVLFATGGGQTEPAGTDGKPAADPLPKPRLPVSVTIGGAEAEILYAGGAPGLVAGVLQVNASVPESVAAGMGVPIVVRIGEAISQPGVTLAVY